MNKIINIDEKRINKINMKQFLRDIDKIIEKSKTHLLLVSCIMFDEFLFQQIVDIKSVDKYNNEIILMTSSVIENVTIPLNNIESYEYIASNEDDEIKCNFLRINYNNRVSLELSVNFK